MVGRHAAALSSVRRADTNLKSMLLDDWGFTTRIVMNDASRQIVPPPEAEEQPSSEKPPCWKVGRSTCDGAGGYGVGDAGTVRHRQTQTGTGRHRQTRTDTQTQIDKFKKVQMLRAPSLGPKTFARRKTKITKQNQQKNCLFEFVRVVSFFCFFLFF